MNHVGRLIYVSLLAGFIGYLIGRSTLLSDVRLAWAAGYSAASIASSAKGEFGFKTTTVIHAACNPLADALNSDKGWSYQRCKHAMIATGEWSKEDE